MKVLLSIKPVFANKIFNGEKLYEFRRIIFKYPDINTVLVYATAPISLLIGEFEIDEIIHCEIKNLWKQTSEYSGISEEFFFKYFSGKQKGYAIKIKKYTKYEKLLDVKKYLGMNSPQSFAYIKN